MENILPCRRTFQASAWAAPLHRLPLLCQTCHWRAKGKESLLPDDKFCTASLRCPKGIIIYWYYVKTWVQTHLVHTVALPHHCTINSVLRRQGGKYSWKKSHLRKKLMLMDIPPHLQVSPLLDILLWGVSHLCLASRSSGFEPPWEWVRIRNGSWKSKAWHLAFRGETNQANMRLYDTMTIQKLSSGSKKNCRFFCVCRDLAGLTGQNVLKEKWHQ